MTIPLEDTEAEALAIWLNWNKYKFTHIGNEAGQSGTKNIIAMMNKKKKMGVCRGFPDYCIILKIGALLFIELKRQRRVLKNGKLGKSPSIISEEQKDWIDVLDNIENVGACVCYGWEDAKNKILYYENL